MSKYRAEHLSDLKEELLDLIERIQAEVEDIEMSNVEHDVWTTVDHHLGNSMEELDYLISLLDNSDEKDYYIQSSFFTYDEDGNPEDDDMENDMIIE